MTFEEQVRDALSSHLAEATWEERAYVEGFVERVTPRVAAAIEAAGPLGRSSVGAQSDYAAALRALRGTP